MSGKDYVAQTRLTDRAGEVLAEVGETCERVPASSLLWLVDQGLVIPGAKAPKAGPRPVAKADEPETTKEGEA